MSDIMLEALRELRNQNKKPVSEAARIRKPHKPVEEGKMLDHVKARAAKVNAKEVVEEEAEDEVLNEDIQDIFDTHSADLPATPLPKQDILDFIDALPAPADRVPPVFFKLGYMREIAPASKFTGGRGWREGMPLVKILKCIEYSSLYTGTDWRGTRDTREVDALLGTERHTGERTGFNHDGTNKIGYYHDDTSRPVLQAYPAHSSRQRVKYFVSVNGGELVEASREEVAQYLTPANANKLLNPQAQDRGFNSESGVIGTDTPINRFDLRGIYMIGNLGHSIM